LERIPTYFPLTGVSYFYVKHFIADCVFYSQGHDAFACIESPYLLTVVTINWELQVNVLNLKGTFKILAITQGLEGKTIFQGSFKGSVCKLNSSFWLAGK